MRSDFSHFQTKHAAQDLWHKIWAHVDNNMTRYSLPKTTYQAVYGKGRKQKQVHFNSKFDMHRCQIHEISRLNNNLQYA